MQFVDLKTQSDRIRPKLDARFEAIFEHGRFVNGPEIEDLERELARYCGAPHCVAVSSGTDALTLSLLALEIEPGDEVITTAFSFFATAGAIALIGAVPVFVDIDESNFNIAIEEIEKAISGATKAILAVSLFGQPPDMDRINNIAERHGLKVIEDGAQSFGAKYRGRKSCNLSDLGTTSFFPSKPLGCYGDGGACMTGDDTTAALLRSLRDHGQSQRYRHERIGLNARMDTLQAAVLLEKLSIYDSELARRQRVAELYSKLLGERAPAVVTPAVDAGSSSTFAQYTIRLPDRDRVLEELETLGIPCAVHYPQPLHKQPVFLDGTRSRVVGDLRNSERAAAEVLSLPLHPYLDDHHVVQVVDAISSASRT